MNIDEYTEQYRGYFELAFDRTVQEMILNPQFSRQIILKYLPPLLENMNKKLDDLNETLDDLIRVKSGKLRLEDFDYKDSDIIEYFHGESKDLLEDMRYFFIFLTILNLL